MNLRDHAKGRWPEIITALVGEEFANPRKHQPCPAGVGVDRYRFSDVNGAGNFFCGCSQGEKDGFDLLKCCKGMAFAEAARAVEGVIGRVPDDGRVEAPKKTGIVDRIRAIARPAQRSRYLESRGLEMAPGLLFAEALDYFDDGKKIGTYAAMVAPVARNGELLTYHVTYLHRGAKAPVTPCRKIMPIAPGALQGAGVALWDAQEVMGVSEGIETAIAASMIYQMPVAAALNTSLMKAWEPPSIAKRIVIFADNDLHFAGHAAAYALAHRLQRKGLRVSVEIPPMIGDWNDVLLAQRSAA